MLKYKYYIVEFFRKEMVAIKRQYFWWAMVFIWGAVVIFLSTQNAENSAGLSEIITSSVVDFLSDLGINVPKDKLESIIRNAAHVNLHLIFGFIYFHAVSVTNHHSTAPFLFCWCVCIILAVGDELVQLYVIGRAVELADICYNLSGVLLGRIASHLINKRKISHSY